MDVVSRMARIARGTVGPIPLARGTPTQRDFTHEEVVEANGKIAAAMPTLTVERAREERATIGNAPGHPPDRPIG
jgi:hypothetical protein